MKCQSLFSGKNKKNINLSFAELAPSMVSIKYYFYFPKVQYNERFCFLLKLKRNVKSVMMFVCVEVLRPSQPNGVMSSAVSLPNHMFTGQA